MHAARSDRHDRYDNYASNQRLTGGGIEMIFVVLGVSGLSRSLSMVKTCPIVFNSALNEKPQIFLSNLVFQYLFYFS